MVHYPLRPRGAARPIRAGLALRSFPTVSRRELEFATLDGLVSPILLYVGCAIGAVGVCMALPRRGVSPQLVGALIAAIGAGAVFLGIALRTADSGGLPNFHFYLFTLIALGSALRVISHPRPVYAALYFVLTIVASSGLYVLLSAEFMAFALIIVYAGAILITYLFVIMLATESPTADEVEALAEYDRYSREPALAAVVGFVLVAAMTTMLAKGTPALAVPTEVSTQQQLAFIPGKIDRALRQAGLMSDDERIARGPERADGTPGAPMVDLSPGGYGVQVEYGDGQTRLITPSNPKWPKDLDVTNPEGVGIALLSGAPGAIEVAGVILLMAMLGAVVLARKKVELDEAEKLAAQSRTLPDSPLSPAHGGGL